MAAARKVSAATSVTLWRRFFSRCASLAVLVVLPVPFTPTTRMTFGFAGSGRSGGGIEGQDLRDFLARHFHHVVRP